MIPRNVFIFKNETLETIFCESWKSIQGKLRTVERVVFYKQLTAIGDCEELEEIRAVATKNCYYGNVESRPELNYCPFTIAVPIFEVNEILQFEKANRHKLMENANEVVFCKFEQINGCDKHLIEKCLCSFDYVLSVSVIACCLSFTLLVQNWAKICFVDQKQLSNHSGYKFRI